jgi:AcrR family transcriptional regulator
MSPKILSEQEKKIRREYLLSKGRELFVTYGVRKTSVDDIIMAAKMAKGTFYQYFESKEVFFLEILVQFHSEWFQKAEDAFNVHGDIPVYERFREYIKENFNLPNYHWIFKYHDDIENLLLEMYQISPEKVEALLEMEHTAYERLLQLWEIDDKRVQPGVIHNYLHTMYFCIANAELMEKDYINETFEALLDGLIFYIFK